MFTSSLENLFLTACLVISCSVTAAVANDADSPAQAAYPKPFSRPPSMGENYDTWKDAKGPDVGETATDIRRLPSRVDNNGKFIRESVVEIPDGNFSKTPLLIETSLH